MGGATALRLRGQIQVSADLCRDTLLTPWRIDKKVVGFYKRVGNLWLRNINDAGHLVPMDQGAVALALVNDFVKGSLGEQRQEGKEQIRVDSQ